MNEQESMPTDSYIFIDGHSKIFFPQWFWNYSYGLTNVPGWVASAFVEKYIPNWNHFSVYEKGIAVCGSVRPRI